jgi:hypothetical protein
MSESFLCEPSLFAPAADVVADLSAVSLGGVTAGSICASRSCASASCCSSWAMRSLRSSLTAAADGT